VFVQEEQSLFHVEELADSGPDSLFNNKYNGEKTKNRRYLKTTKLVFNMVFKYGTKVYNAEFDATDLLLTCADKIQSGEAIAPSLQVTLPKSLSQDLLSQDKCWFYVKEPLYYHRNMIALAYVPCLSGREVNHDFPVMTIESEVVDNSESVEKLFHFKQVIDKQDSLF
jgi:hypothetical protein